MRRSYEFKQESHIVQESESWGYPPYEEYHHEVSPPIIHKMVQKPSFQHLNPSYDHDDEDHDEVVSSGTRWDGSRGWCGTHRLNNSVTLKKNEHHALGAKSILRPPLGAVTPPSHHQYRQQYATYGGLEQTGWNRDDHMQYFRGGEGSTRQSMFMNKKSNGNNNWMEASRKSEDYGHGNGYNNWMEASRKSEYHGRGNGNNNWMEAPRKCEDYGRSSNNSNWMEASNKMFANYGHKARLEEELEQLIKGLRDSGLDGQVVKQIEVIEYERRSTTYGGGLIRAHKQPYPFYNN